MNSRNRPSSNRPQPQPSTSRLRNPTTTTTTLSTTTKRDSLAAELERDPQLSTAKRQQRAQTLNTTLSQAALERKLAAAETTRVQLETRLRERDTAIERLEADRRWLAEREQEEREEKDRVSKELEEEKTKADHDIRSLRSSLSILQEDHVDLQDKYDSLSHSTSQKIATQAAELTSLSHQVESLSVNLREAYAASETHSAEVLRLQSALDAQAASQADLSRHEAEEATWSVLRAELTRQAEHTRHLEAVHARATTELSALRERHAIIEVLREENRALERRAAAADQLRETVVRLEAEVQAARAEREAWVRNVVPETPSSTPITITQSLSALRLEHAHLLEDHGADRAALRQREAELAEAQAREVDARAAADAFLQSTRAAEERAMRAERTATLAEREVGFLQALNASYVSEETAQGTGHIDEAKEQHVKDLETLIDDYKAHIRTLETEIQELAKRPALEHSSGLQALRDEMVNGKHALQEARRALEEREQEGEKDREKIEELEQTLFELRGEIGAGRHVPPGVRVLSLCSNPAQDWVDLRQATLDRLKGENEALLQHLATLEARGGGDREDVADIKTTSSSSSNDVTQTKIKTNTKTTKNDDDDVNASASAGAGASSSAELVPRASWEAMRQEKVQLEEELKQKEKRMLRLRQVFTAKTAEFRETLSAILGVKIAFYDNGQVRVTSQYDLGAAFVFQPARGGGGSGGSGTGAARMQLVAQGEGGPQELPQLMRNWVEMEQSIPCFLASVTLECYDKWKREREMDKGEGGNRE
ncbi:mitotic checkpoint protein-domain-containing protein [Multifurca ochricompacta]|uniref:Spindle assembly checkpoint component MAD1 n=1 Tax=Multifurca ochricompacta TaxID=376703 RepID=A0AAD4QJJ5_9AGAM|nr:mitotic checkpoint protein-domain-containing protein [Multifurca ochricompacta]